MSWIVENWQIILSSVLSALGGGFIGFRIGVNKKQKLVQKAGDGARQIQIGKGNINVGK